MEEAAWDGEDPSSALPSAPIPRHERSWRHPSEIGRAAYALTETRTLSRPILFAAGLTGIAITLVLGRLLLPSGSSTGNATSTATAAGALTTAATLAPATPVSRLATTRAPSLPGEELDDVGGDGAWLGIRSLSQPGQEAVVARVDAGSPADLAGVEAGDMIVEVNGETVVGFGEIRAAMEVVAPGDTVHLHVRRGATEVDVDVIATRWPTAPPSTSTTTAAP